MMSAALCGNFVRFAHGSEERQLPAVVSALVAAGDVLHLVEDARCVAGMGEYLPKPPRVRTGALVARAVAGDVFLLEAGEGAVKLLVKIGALEVAHGQAERGIDIRYTRLFGTAHQSQRVFLAVRDPWEHGHKQDTGGQPCL